MDPQRPILEFKNASSQPILLRYLGGLIGNSSDFSNPSIQCVRYPAEELPDGEFRIINRPFVVPVGVAALGALETGRFYIDGVLSRKTHSTRHRRCIELSVPSNESAYKDAETDIKIKLYSGPVEKGNHAAKSVVLSAIKTLPARSLHLRNSSVRQETPGANIEVMIPELEIIRYYYTNSNLLIRALFSGHFEEHVLYDNVLAEDISKAFYDADADVHWFQYRSVFSRHDVPLIGRILFSPQAMAGADRVHRSLTISAMPRGKIAHAQTMFPFTGSTRLTVLGSWGYRGGKRYFWVDRIEQCTAPFPFRTLRAMNTSAPTSTEASDHSKAEQKPSVVMTGTLLPNAPMSTLALGAANSPISESTPELRHLVGAFQIEHQRPPPALKDRAKRIFIRGNEWTQTSPGGTTSGNTETARQHLADDLVAGAIPKGLEGIQDVLERLAPLVGHSTSAGLPTLAVGREMWKDPKTGIIYCAFPARLERERFVNPFSFTTTSCEFRRYFVVAEVKTPDNGYFYVIDAQQRKNRNGNFEQLGVRLMAARDKNPIPMGVLEQFIADTVDIKRWAEASGIAFKSLKHTGGSVVAELHNRLAEAILEPDDWLGA